MYFSLIIPVYNRPQEIEELLESLTRQDFKNSYEIIIIEDGSTIPSEEICKKYQDQLNINYFFTKNTGPGDSRNYGMKVAKGDYFIIFDSDCIIPTDYLSNVSKSLNDDYVDCFGGIDDAHLSFTATQKAINYAMTSFLTTGGIRGGSEKLQKFQPRSFNMGLSKKAFEASGGFGNIHPGEDPDLSIRLWKLGFKTKLIPEAKVYHKRRIDWSKFSLQVFKFGKARPILDKRYPEYTKVSFLFPTLFTLGLFTAIVLSFFWEFLLIKLFVVYFLTVLLHSVYVNKSVIIGLYSLLAVIIQFCYYGYGYAISFVKIRILNQKPEEAFPELFFTQ